MKRKSRHAGRALLPLAALLAVFSACGGGSAASTVGPNAQKPELQSIQLGTLVDIYAYQRINETDADRRRRFNRRLELVARDVVVDPNITTDALFDAADDLAAVHPDCEHDFPPAVREEAYAFIARALRDA